MIPNIFTALLFGAVFTLVPDAIFFTGIQRNYIEYYAVAIYFNQLFSDNQYVILYLASSAIFGYGIIYSRLRILFFVLYLVIIIGAATALDREQGRKYGELMFMKKNITIDFESKEQKVDILYIGRNILFYKEGDSLDAKEIEKSKIPNLENLE